MTILIQLHYKVGRINAIHSYREKRNKSLYTLPKKLRGLQIKGTWKINRDVLTLTEVFVNQKRVNM